MLNKLGMLAVVPVALSFASACGIDPSAAIELEEPTERLSGEPSDAALEDGAQSGFSYVLVPNRSDSTLAALSASGELLGKVTRDLVGFEFEPIYAAHLETSNLIIVSDRMNSRLMVFDSRSLAFFGYIPASEGLFHMWPSADSRTLFAVADIENVVDVVTVNRTPRGIFYSRDVFDVGAAVPGGKPHDVVADGSHFYVTVQVESEDRDEVLKVHKRRLDVDGSLSFSIDTHLGMPLSTPFLLVPESVDGELNFVHRGTFEVLQTVPNLPGAHGIYWDRLASRIFVADFSSTGPDSVYEVQRTPGYLNAERVDSVDLPDAKAHNITVDFDNGLMFVTHSGPNNDGELNRNVAIVDISDEPTYVESVETGSNPLGILLVHNRY